MIVENENVGENNFYDADLRENLSEEFILSVGNTKPYKNVERLIEAFAQNTATFPTTKLVILGRITQGIEKLLVKPSLLATLSETAKNYVDYLRGYNSAKKHGRAMIYPLATDFVIVIAATITPIKAIQNIT